MMDYRFRQAYAWGDDWDGELRNIPENAVFYKICAISERQEEWYIMIPQDAVEDRYEWSTEYDGVGCAQVQYYNLLEYRIIHLNNIKPYGEWPDVGEEKFNDLFGDFFRSIYVIERTQAKYEWDTNSVSDNIDEIINYREVEPSRIVAVHRLSKLSNEGGFESTRAVVYDALYKQDVYGLLSVHYPISDLQGDFYDPLKLKREVTHSCLEYEKAFNEVTEKLF